MVDVNKIVRDILVSMNLENVAICFYHPDEKQKLPVISYYENTTTTGFCCDNAEQAQNSNVSIDVWANGGGECSRIAIQVDKAMQSAGWYRELSRDMPPDDGIRHKAMRFSKQIYLQEE